MSQDYDAMTIPQLRSLAARHDVAIPDKVMRKADWVELCNSKIPKAPKPQSPRPAKAKAAASPKAAPRTPKSPKAAASPRPAAAPSPGSPLPPGTAGSIIPWIGPSPKRDQPPKRHVPPLSIAPPSPRPATPAPPSPAPASPRAREPAARRWSAKSISWIILVGAAAVGLKYVMPVRRPFCGAEAVPDCIPCPAHGKCVDGGLQCEDAYVRSKNECIEKRGARHAANQFAAILSRELASAKGEKECGLEVETIWFEERVNNLLDEFLGNSGDIDARAKKQLIWKDLKNPQRLEERGLAATVANGFYSLTATKSWGCWSREIVWDVWLIMWKPLLALCLAALAMYTLHDRIKWRRLLYSEITRIIQEETVTSPYLKGPSALDIAEAIREAFPSRARQVTDNLVTNICKELVKKRGSKILEDIDVNRGNVDIYWYGSANMRDATPKRTAPASPRLF